MSRWLLRWALALSLLARSGLVQAQEPEARAAWQARYEHARSQLILNHYSEAAVELEALSRSAPTEADRKLAGELAALARSVIEQRAEEARAGLRGSDEIVLLYTAAVLYGLGTAGWLTLQIEPESFGVALLPFALITPAAVGAVALADSYRPLRRGVPHAIAAGLYLGFGEALWVVGYQHAYASHHDQTPFEAEQASTVLWVGATVGAGVGGLIGALGPPTPGRMSFTASAAIWSGLLGAFAAGAIEPEQRQRGQASYLVAGIAYNAGLLAGIALGGTAEPSVARMRFVDLAGLFGALVGAGGYALIAQDFGSRGSFASTAIGGVVGLGLGWWATSGMPRDRDLQADRQNARNSLANLYGLRPMLVPAAGGFAAGVIGDL